MPNLTIFQVNPDFGISVPQSLKFLDLDCLLFNLTIDNVSIGIIKITVILIFFILRKMIWICLDFKNFSRAAQMQLEDCMYLMRVVNPHTKRSVLSMTLNCIQWSSSRSEHIGSIEYLFITLTPRSTLTLKR